MKSDLVFAILACRVAHSKCMQVVCKTIPLLRSVTKWKSSTMLRKQWQPTECMNCQECNQLSTKAGYCNLYTVNHRLCCLYFFFLLLITGKNDKQDFCFNILLSMLPVIPINIPHQRQFVTCNMKWMIVGLSWVQRWFLITFTMYALKHCMYLILLYVWLNWAHFLIHMYTRIFWNIVLRLKICVNVSFNFVLFSAYSFRVNEVLYTEKHE